jgi:hypothetical protein
MATTPRRVGAHRQQADKTLLCVGAVIALGVHKERQLVDRAEPAPQPGSRPRKADHWRRLGMVACASRYSCMSSS